MKTYIKTLIVLVVIVMGAIGINSAEKYEIATLAGGCFWCMESPFEKLEGVKEVISGYSGGFTENPTYEEVSAGGTGHYEAVQVIYDPQIISYKEILDVFWMQINPTDANGQFVDKGDQYRSAIFYHNENQKKIAETSKKELQKSGRFNKDIVTDIVKFKNFFKAEEYHQDYYKNNPIRYHLYRFGSGRDQFLDKVWGKDRNKHKKNDDKEDLKSRLTPIQYKVTQEEGTEPPFNNEYWDNKEEGIYVDIVSGEPLFSSNEKYKSGTGWPSFYAPLVTSNIIEKEDHKLFMKRIEVKSKEANSHLGHVFDDGPAPTGLRYCINSAALKFIPKEDLKKEGYEEYEKIFK